MRHGYEPTRGAGPGGAPRILSHGAGRASCATAIWPTYKHFPTSATLSILKEESTHHLEENYSAIVTVVCPAPFFLEYSWTIFFTEVPTKENADLLITRTRGMK